MNVNILFGNNTSMITTITDIQYRLEINYTILLCGNDGIKKEVTINDIRNILFNDSPYIECDNIKITINEIHFKYYLQTQDKCIIMHKLKDIIIEYNFYDYCIYDKFKYEELINSINLNLSFDSSDNISIFAETDSNKQIWGINGPSLKVYLSLCDDTRKQFASALQKMQHDFNEITNILKEYLDLHKGRYYKKEYIRGKILQSIINDD